MKYLDKIANLAVIVGVVVFLVVIYRTQFEKHITPGSSAQDSVGRTVSLPSIELPKNRDSLLLVVSTTCHFCKESMPFL
jgi:hypothetical protein